MDSRYILITQAYDEFILIETFDHAEEIKELIYNLQEQGADEGTNLDLNTVEEGLFGKYSDVNFVYFDSAEDVIEL